MQRTDAKVIADHQRRIARRKELERYLREGGIRLPKSRHSPAFEAGARAKLAEAGK